MNIRAAVLVLLTLTGCFSRGGNQEMKHTGAPRFLALGDSYTIGESVDKDQRWPMQLAAMLRARGIEVSEPEIIARTGWTTDELSEAIDGADPKGPYELVSLLIGVNNQYRGRDVENYRAEFRQLLARAIDFAGGNPARVIVLSIPDWGVTPFAREKGRDATAVGRDIDAYNAVNRDESAHAGVAYIDVTPGSRRAARDASLLAEDGLHPSGRMYAEWATMALTEAERILRPRSGR